MINLSQSRWVKTSWVGQQLQTHSKTSDHAWASVSSKEDWSKADGKKRLVGSWHPLTSQFSINLLILFTSCWQWGKGKQEANRVFFLSTTSVVSLAVLIRQHFLSNTVHFLCRTSAVTAASCVSELPDQMSCELHPWKKKTIELLLLQAERTPSTQREFISLLFLILGPRRDELMNTEEEMWVCRMVPPQTQMNSQRSALGWTQTKDKYSPAVFRL